MPHLGTNLLSPRQLHLAKVPLMFSDLSRIKILPSLQHCE
jgi:hypothetical protein